MMLYRSVYFFLLMMLMSWLNLLVMEVSYIIYKG